MAHFTFDEREIEHLYVAAKDHGDRIAKARKEALKLKLSTPAIAEYDDQLVRNINLRQVLDPQAEMLAREAARKKRGDRRDPRQLEIPVEVGGRKAERADASPNGKKGHKPKRVSTSPIADGMDVVNADKTEPPTDELLSRRLWEVCGLTIGTDVLHKWTSSEREQAEGYIAAVQARTDATTAGLPTVPPEPPHCIWNQMWRKSYAFNPRGSQLMVNAPAKEREYWADAGPFTIRKAGNGSQAKFFVGGILDGELQELEITDKLGLPRMKDAAVVWAAKLNQQFRGRALVGGEQFATQWVMKSLKHPGSCARYVQPAHTPNVAATAEATP